MQKQRLSDLDGEGARQHAAPPGGKRPVSPLTKGGPEGAPRTDSPEKSPKSPESGSLSGSLDLGSSENFISVLATFTTHDAVLDAVSAPACVSWLIIDAEAAHRALLPALTHVQLQTTLKRLDEITLAEARDVIRKLADERERIIERLPRTQPESKSPMRP